MPSKATIQSILHNPRLPSLPAVAIKVLELTRDDNVNFREVADVIQNDQALSIKIIRTVNSSYFGLSRPCTSISQAIVFLGLNTVKTLVLGFSLADSIDGSCEHDIGFDYASYWRRSLHAAVAAREIARVTDACDPEEAFLAALIQDVGMIALYRAFRDVYIQILDLANGHHAKLVAKEQQALEMDHAEVGAAIGEMWKLPEPLTCAIAHHHDTGRTPAAHAELTRVVETANAAAAMFSEPGETDAATAAGPSAAEFTRLMGERAGIASDDAMTMFQTLQDGARELASLFKVDINSPTEVDNVLSEAEDLRVYREVSRSHDERASKAATIATAEPDSPSSALSGAGGGPSGSVVCPTVFRQQLRSAILHAREHDGECIGLMMCRCGAATEDDETDDAAPPNFFSAEAIATHVGIDVLVCADRPDRVSMLLPRCDRVMIARLANTIRKHAGPASTSNPSGQIVADVPINIGAATYEWDSKQLVTDEQKLISLAEHALSMAETSGPGAIRIFNPTPRADQAA